MNLTLTPELEAMVQEKVERGDYPDVGEVVREALRLLDDRDRLRRLKAALAIGQEQIDRGEARVYSPELRAEIHEAARRKVRDGARLSDDVVP